MPVKEDEMLANRSVGGLLANAVELLNRCARSALLFGIQRSNVETSGRCGSLGKRTLLRDLRSGPLARTPCSSRLFRRVAHDRLGRSSGS